MTTKKKLKPWVKYAIAVLALVIVISGFFLFKKPEENNQDEVVNTPLPTQQTEVVETLPTTNTRYQEYKSKNDDYLGYLEFESGLVSQPTVQGVDNEYYLNNNVFKEYTSRGSAFMDYRNSLNDQNIIFYGHFVYDDETLMFSQLHALKEESAYEANKMITLELEDSVRTYQVAYVYYYEMNNPNLEYFHTNYEPEQLQNYLNSVEEKQFYDTGIDITSEDTFLTLQTCVRGRNDLRLIVIAKEIK